MRLMVLGKVGNITHWVEDAVAAFRAAGHQVVLGVTRDPRLSRAIETALVNPAFGNFRGWRIALAMRKFQPDLILAIMPYVMPPTIIDYVAGLPHRPPFFGWAGDVFEARDRRIADQLDLVAYTDSGLIDRHVAFGFKPPALFLPHAASPRAIDQVPAFASRQDCMVFVASVTPHRRAMIRQINSPIVLYGPGWRDVPAGGHIVHARRVTDQELAAIYPMHIAALNVTNEENVLLGLNQRNFTPYLSATPVVSDDQPDLECCFEPGHEVLVYRDVAELDDLYARIRADRNLAEKIGQRGRARVLAEHGYAHRLDALAARI